MKLIWHLYVTKIQYDNERYFDTSGVAKVRIQVERGTLIATYSY